MYNAIVADSWLNSIVRNDPWTRIDSMFFAMLDLSHFHGSLFTVQKAQTWSILDNAYCVPQQGLRTGPGNLVWTGRHYRAFSLENINLLM